MKFSDLDTVTNAAILVTDQVDAFPAIFTAAISERAPSNRHYLLVHNQEQKAISIELVRELKQSAAYGLGPHERQEIVLLWADLLSIPAQHALLKLLEEPPASTRLWLVTSSPQSLLETVQSRCVRLILADQADSKPLTSISLEAIAPLSYSKLIAMASLPKDRVEAQAWCRAALRSCRVDAATISPRSQNALLHTMEQLQQNANVKLCLEHCLFQLKESVKMVR